MIAKADTRLVAETNFKYHRRCVYQAKALSERMADESKPVPEEQGSRLP